MAALNMPTFEHTSVDTIAGTHSTLNRTFLSGKTRDVQYRLTQLRKLWWALKDNEAELMEACRLDLGKPQYETYLTEVGWVLNDIIFVCNNLEKWAKEEGAADIPLMHMAMRPKIRKEPLGVVLVLGAYNFPIQLSLGPLVGAIAAGCTAVLKPSESAPYAAAVMQHVIKTSLDPAAYTVVQGAIPESTALLDCKWDKIFYTGSATVGTIVAKKAAETLTPVTLELGGRNPAIVTRSADPRLAARRLLWAKNLNAGQVCVSQNYILVDREILPALISELKAAINEFYPNGYRDSEDYGRIVNAKQFDRLKGMLDRSSGKILIGGTMDAAAKYLEPTVVQVSSADDALLADESFGPLMPVLAVQDLDEALRIANAVHATPLGVYAFGSAADTRKILAGTRSGGASVNDGFFHASIPTLEFGGVGDSGTGSYRGRASFDCFTHRRAVTVTPGWAEGLLAVRYPPYKGKLAKLKRMGDLKPDFDRSGKLTPLGWIWWVLAFGSRGAMTALKRWAVLAILLAGYRQYVVRQSRL
ncbi:hypothetical protein MBLNU459_g0767t1 [Dothideomycetes sp. NU459]